MSMWKPIDSAPVDEEVLLYCPNRHSTNQERIEIGVAHSSSGSHHAWATHWAFLPNGPDPAEVQKILDDEAELYYREREMEQLTNDGQL